MDTSSPTFLANQAALEGEEATVTGWRPRLFGDDRWPHPALLAFGAAAVLGGLILRFWAPSAMWLDEALSINIARLPVGQIPRALSHDGSPPLYYLMLHYWMALFGRSDFAARALSGLTSVVALPFFWAAGRRLGGRTVAWVVFFLALSSPFAINYATSARMYSLMILLTLLGYLALARAFEYPSAGRLVAVAAVTAALLYTHYWGIYLVGLAGGLVVWRIWRSGRGRSTLKAMGCGVALWLPWAPVFFYQTLHTGTPWSAPASAGDLLQVFADFSGSGPWGGLLMFATFILFVFGTFGKTAPAGTIVATEDPDGYVRHTTTGPAVVLDLKPRPGTAPLVAVAVGTVSVAVIFGALANAAFVARYTAVVLPLFLLVVSTGLAVMPGRTFRAGCISVLCVAGLLTGIGENSSPRTQATQVATVLNSQAQAGDLVIYCPDQLGPSVDRLLRVPGLEQITFPRAAAPQRVNWVDYTKTINSTDVASFAEEALSRAGSSHTVWLVWRDGYAGLGGACGYLKSWLDLFRGGGVTLVKENGSTYYEFENLTRYTA